ncbi:hypothetical protein [Deinococcus aquaedulcis]|uniref:hypothetical protein n=1 Tax=Deinococcus aquaedulcis TaxID=2840455 RepID=UPI001C82AF6A|nr:hypothetical protein [Deinococcus aquaedulcis]
MTALRARLTVQASATGTTLVLSALNTSDEAIKVVHRVLLRLPGGQSLTLDPASGLTSTQPLPAILHPEDRVALTFPISVVHAALAQLALTPPVVLAACFVDMTGAEYLSPGEAVS